MNTRTALRRMAAQDVPTDERVRRVAPESLREHSLRRILGDRRVHPAPDPAPGGRRWGPVLVVGVAVVAVLAAVAVVVLPGSVGDRLLDGVAGRPADPSVTTSTDPGEVLRRLADRADAQPPVADGPVDYVHTRSWDRPRSRYGEVDPDAAEQQTDAETWQDTTTGRILEHQDGQLIGDFEPVPPRPTRDLPTEPDALEHDLLFGQDGTESDSIAFGMRNLLGTQVVEPRAQAAFLRLLASQRDVRVVGPVVDRLGRQGTGVELTERRIPLEGAVAATEPDFVHTLVIDPGTGGVLSWEEVHFPGSPGTSAGSQPVSHVTTWVKTGRVDSTGERP